MIIFQREFFYLLFGPILATAVVGAMLYVTTKSCTQVLPGSISRSDARRLLSFPDHVCFQNSWLYPGQTGRVLQASWGFTWFIVCSAYSTFLVTTFTTKPQELVLNSFDKILKNTDFKFGVLGSATSALELFHSSRDKTFLKVWDKLIEFNKTDARTLDASTKVHAERIIKGHYAWLTSGCAITGVCKDYFSTIKEDIRAYDLNVPSVNGNCYIGIPINVFYSDTLYKLLLNFEDKGILEHLKNEYFSSERVLNNKEVSKIKNINTPATFTRIKLPFYAVLCGVGLSTVSLGMEIVLSRWKARMMCPW